jgi:hypothetical protein
MNSNATSATLPDRIESTINATTFRELNPLGSSTAAHEKPFGVHVHESAQTQLAALAHALLAGSAVQAPIP